MLRGFANRIAFDEYNYDGGIISSDVWPQNSLDINKIGGRMVEGDFNQDGKINDVAVIYDNGYSNGAFSTAIKIWNFGPGYASNSHDAWTVTGFDANKITGRIVTGDFDNDGYYDDIAAFYDYGYGKTKIDVWCASNGGGTGQNTYFTYSWWWEIESGYYCSGFTDRIVSGDFDHDGYIDDIAVLYDYGGGGMRIHVFKSNGHSFAYQGASGWWSTPSGYSPANINKRVISGNFDKSGLFNHKNDDIVAVFDYGNGNAKVHEWTSNGSSFSYSWKWQVSGFYPSNITGRFTNFQYNDNGDAEHCYDMAALYNYGTGTNKYYHWRNNGSGDFSSFTNALCQLPILAKNTNSDVSAGSEEIIPFYPNPNSGNFLFKYEVAEGSKASLKIMDLTGRKIASYDLRQGKNAVEVNQTTLNQGLYIYSIILDDQVVKTDKFSIIK